MSATLPLDVTLLVLLAALMHATWNAIAKSSESKLLEITAMAVIGGVLCAAALPFMPLPERESWLWLAASVLIHVVYFLALAGAYRWGDLSQAYPLMRGLAPPLVALFGVLLLDERLTGSMWAGIALISAGILLPFAFRSRNPGTQVRGTVFALANTVVIASYTVVDGYGTRLSAHPVSYCLWLFLLYPWPILAFAWLRHRAGVWTYMRRRWMPCAVGGVLTIASYGIALWAMALAPIAAVAALRETSVIFAAIIGSLFLGEGFGIVRITGAVLVACGIVALRLS